MGWSRTACGSACARSAYGSRLAPAAQTSSGSSSPTHCASARLAWFSASAGPCSRALWWRRIWCASARWTRPPSSAPRRSWSPPRRWLRICRRGAPRTRIPSRSFARNEAPMRRRALDEFLPLKPVGLELLLALAGEDRHGYGLVQRISEHTNGLIVLDPGNLYRVIKRLLGDGLIDENPARAAEGDERRRYY